MKQLSKSYMLRTGQMRLPVRAIKSAAIQAMPAVIQELPDYPIIGEYYMYKGVKIKCVQARILMCSGCIKYTLGCDNRKQCIFSMRPGGKSVIFIKAD